MKIPKQPRMQFPGTFDGVVVGAMHMTRDTAWEMHPAGDECLHLLSGAIDVVVEQGGLSQVVELRAGSSCVVPRGHWHRQVVFVIQPSCPPVSDGIIELLMTIDALKHASAGRITAVLP